MEKQSFLQKFRLGNGSIMLIVMVILIMGLVSFIGLSKIASVDDGKSVYKALAFGLVMIWLSIFIIYFIWATYFYNINYGITDKDWKQIYEAKKRRTDGQPFNQNDLDDEPLYNPNHKETFGLPNGTVRGMIAFSLLFGALALLIASLGMDTNIKSNSFFYDQFEFFKTAFLMMIAFYFGSRSLQYLKSNNDSPSMINTAGRIKDPTAPGTEQDSMPRISQLMTTLQEPIIFDHSDPRGDKKPDNDKEPINAIDPMAPKQ